MAIGGRKRQASGSGCAIVGTTLAGLYRVIEAVTRPAAQRPATLHGRGSLTYIGASDGPLPQYFPKGGDLRVYTAADLAVVAAELNARPRKTLDWDSPAQRLHALLPGLSRKR